MWAEGALKGSLTGREYKYWVKHFEEGSDYGIEGGRISKLTIRRVGEGQDLVHYERGWATTPKDEETKEVYEKILSRYN